MTPCFASLIRAVAGIAAMAAASAHAVAPPTLTAAGIAKGFTLSTIVSGLPSSNGSSYDVLGSAVNSDGNIILNNARPAGTTCSRTSTGRPQRMR